ncbi:MAG: DEAD/DEAH box helicase [Verrucomicrobia bacterium]|nr:DEAD/DEAH box helicase [Verrucomicrobiota bacterium]
MQTFAESLAGLSSLQQQVIVPDLWQQQAVSALRAGQDVVVHAPTGAGKTLIFELWSHHGKNRGQAIYTVPTRALANDKLAEWRARGWNVGIATGDLAENLDAPVIVATLETQKNRLIRGDGPALLVVDEYQMIADPDRGLNYELAIALAPPQTQLLLLSGSVSNPQDVVKWLRRLGRRALLVRTDERPVPLEEVHANSLSYHVPSEIRGYWPRLAAKVLAEGLGPLLLFAPRRQMAETLAGELSRQLPNPDPLTLTPAQRLLVGENLARLLKTRIAYHHSGLSYAVRAGVVEPLAKAGQLRVVVATMGLAAGINFSLRSVALVADSYRRDAAEQALRPDEILQMFGRAGRRGIDETGYVIVAANEIRIHDAHATHLARNGMADWNALLGIMHGAAEQGRDPFAEAVRIQERLFTVKPIPLGVEESLKHPAAPCGLKTDAERARFVRRRVREFLNSRGEWERQAAHREVPLGEVRVARSELREPEPGDAAAPAWHVALRPALAEPTALEKAGNGALAVIEENDGLRLYGRALTVAERLPDDRVIIAKWIRRLTNWHGRQATLQQWRERLAPRVEARLASQRTPVTRFIESPQKIVAELSLAAFPVRVPVDRHGVALWKPRERDVLPDACARCELVATCRGLVPSTGTALLWRRLGLVDAGGVPTRRGRIASFFHQGDGLGIAAALEDESLALEDLIYELANLHAGFRFAGDDNRWAGRLALASQRAYGLQMIPGYLEHGVPHEYGAGAEEMVASVHKNPESRHAWVTQWLGAGDVDRVIIEWRSLLRQVTHAPELDWPRWQRFRELARATLNETESPTLTELPPLDYHQTRRIEHRLNLRRH